MTALTALGLSRRHRGFVVGAAWRDVVADEPCRIEPDRGGSTATVLIAPRSAASLIAATSASDWSQSGDRRRGQADQRGDAVQQRRRLRRAPVRPSAATRSISAARCCA